MRGPHPKDKELFCETELARLREGAADLRYLLERGYAQPGALKLVGDRFQFLGRQRQALYRSVFAPSESERIRSSRLKPDELAGRPLLIDGHNVLITIETALGGGLLIRCDDGFLRDIAEKHGSYRQSEHTERAINLLERALQSLRPSRVNLFLDRPIPFSGLLARRLREAVGEGAAVSVVPSADGAIKEEFRSAPDAVAATSDSALLKSCAATFDLPSFVVEKWIPRAWVIFAEPAERPESE